MKRTLSSSSEVRRKLDRFRALRNDPATTRDFALGVIESESNPELLAAALRALGENVRPEDGPVLRDLYRHFAESGRKRDAGGQLRAAVLGVLWHLRDRDDIPLAIGAARTVEQNFQGDGDIIRAAGLALLGVLDPEAGTHYALVALGANDASRMTGEPAMTAIRLLANLGHPEPLALFVVASEESTMPDLLAEAFRGLTGVPSAHLRPLIELYSPHPDSDDRPRRLDDVALLGLCDLLIALELDDTVARALRQYLRVSSLDVYAVLATSIVASRRPELIALFLESLPTEVGQPRLKIALDALRLAPQTPEVEAATARLVERTTGEPTLADLAGTFDEDVADD